MDLPDTHRTRRDLGLELAVVSLVVVLPLLVDGLTGRVPRSLPVADEVFYGVLGLGSIAVIVYLTWRNDGSPRAAGFRPTSWIRELAWAAAIYLIAWPVTVVAERATAGLEAVPEEPWVIPVAPAVYLLVYAVFEEVIRAYLTVRVRQLTGSTWIAMLVAWLAFVFGHPYELASMIHVAAFGLLFGVAFLLGQSVPRLALAHWAYNVALEYELWPVPQIWGGG